MCISSLTSEFPEDCKFYAADTKDELHKVIVCTSKLIIQNADSAIMFWGYPEINGIRLKYVQWISLIILTLLVFTLIVFMVAVPVAF